MTRALVVGIDGRELQGRPTGTGRYLRSLLRRFDGDLVLALAAYNAGPGAVERFQDVPPYRETKHYVARVLSLYVDHHQALWETTGASEFVFDVEELPIGDLGLAAEAL